MVRGVRVLLSVEEGCHKPFKKRITDAGIDLPACEEVTLRPGEMRVVKTGIHAFIPPGTVGLIKDRSGQAAKRGLHVMAGVIDAGYTGELVVVLVNLGPKEVRIRKGERIAQFILLPAISAMADIEIVPHEEIVRLSEMVSDRKENKFGSSGF